MNFTYWVEALGYQYRFQTGLSFPCSLWFLRSQWVSTVLRLFLLPPALAAESPSIRCSSRTDSQQNLAAPLWVSLMLRQRGQTRDWAQPLWWNAWTGRARHWISTLVVQAYLGREWREQGPGPVGSPRWLGAGVQGRKSSFVLVPSRLPFQHCSPTVWSFVFSSPRP